MCAMMADEETARFIGGVQPPNSVWRALCALVGSWELYGHGMFSVIEKASGMWIGRLGPWYPADWPGTEVGWGLVRAAWGRGYASEGAAAAMDYAVDVLGWGEIIHCIDAANTPSVKVAQRLGSCWLREVAAPAPINNVTWQIYGQTADEWRARRRQR